MLRSYGAHDLHRAGKFFQENFHNRMTPEEMDVRLGIFANFMIVFFINMSRRDSVETRQQIIARLKALINAPDIRNWFRYYRAKPGQSRLIPLFLKWRLPTALFVLARIKSEKRYHKALQPRAEKRRGLAWFS